MTSSPVTMYMNSLFTEDTKAVNGTELYPTKSDAFNAHTDHRHPPLILAFHTELPRSFRNRDATNQLLDALTTAWKNHPHLRLGQLLYVINPSASTFALTSDSRACEILLASSFMEPSEPLDEEDDEEELDDHLVEFVERVAPNVSYRNPVLTEEQIAAREAEIESIIGKLRDYFMDKDTPSTCIYVSQLIARIADEADTALFFVLDEDVVEYLDNPLERC